MNWVHRPDRHNVDEDILRNVYFGQAFVGRIYRLEHGPRSGQWNWGGAWGGLFDDEPVPNGGTCETREQALGDLKATCLRLAKETPDAIRQMLDRDFRVRGVADDYLAKMRNES